MILVTGSTGMIGRAVVNRLLEDGHRVRAHGRSTLALSSIDASKKENLEPGIADFAEMQIDEARKLTANCSAIVHCAGLVHQPNAANELYDSLNVRATNLLAEAARANQVEQFIFLSSSSVYGNRATEMISESAELHGDTPYAASKISSEKELNANPPAPSTVILRPSLVFGEGDRGNMLSLIRQVLSGKYFIVGEGSASKSLILANDLASAIAAILKTTSHGCATFNIANPLPVTVKELSESILKAANKPASLPRVPSWIVHTAAGAANCILGKRSPLSPDRLAKLTRSNSVSVDAFTAKYKVAEPTNLSSALAVEIQWARNENLLG